MFVICAGSKTVFTPNSVTEKDAKKYFHTATGIEETINFEVK